MTFSEFVNRIKGHIIEAKFLIPYNTKWVKPNLPELTEFILNIITKMDHVKKKSRDTYSDYAGGSDSFKRHAAEIVDYLDIERFVKAFELIEKQYKSDDLRNKLKSGFALDCNDSDVYNELAKLLVNIIIKESENVTINKKSKNTYHIESKVSKYKGYYVENSRDEDLAKVRKTFVDKSEKVVFLNGTIGIGKTVFVKKYIERYKGEYNTVIYCQYQGGLAKLIANDEYFSINGLCRKIKIDGSYQTDEEYAKEKIKILNKTADEKMLIIIDDFNSWESDSLLEEFISENKFHILLVSDNDCNSRYEEMGYKLAQMKDKYLEFLVRHYSGDGKYMNLAECSYTEWKELFKITDGNTFTLELIASYMKENTISSIKEITELLKENGFDDVVNTSDNHLVNQYKKIKKLFDLSNLQENAKEFLRIMSFVPEWGIREELAQKLFGTKVFGCKNELVRKHFVEREECFIKLHPLIESMVRQELVPSVNNCESFLKEYVSYINELDFLNFTKEEKRFCAALSKKVFKTVMPKYFSWYKDSWRNKSCDELIEAINRENVLDGVMDEKSFGILHELSKTVYADGKLPISSFKYRLPQYIFVCKEYGDNSLEACMTVVPIGQIYLLMGEYESAWHWQKYKAYDMLKNNPRTDELLYWDILERSVNQLGYICVRTEIYKKYFEIDLANGTADIKVSDSENYFKEGFASTEEMARFNKYTKEFINYKKATAVSGLCEYYTIINNQEGLEKRLQELDACYTIENKGKFDAANLARFKGCLFLMEENYQDAVEKFKEAIEIRESYVPKKSFSDVLLYMNLLESYSNCRDCLTESEKTKFKSDLEFSVKQIFEEDHPILRAITERISCI